MAIAIAQTIHLLSHLCFQRYGLQCCTTSSIGKTITNKRKIPPLLAHEALHTTSMSATI